MTTRQMPRDHDIAAMPAGRIPRNPGLRDHADVWLFAALLLLLWVIALLNLGRIALVLPAVLAAPLSVAFIVRLHRD